VPCMHAPSTGGVFMVWAVFPPIGEVGNTRVKHSTGDIGGDRGIVEDAWFESSVGIGASQCAERVVLLPSCVPIEFLKPCQIFSKVCHSVIGITEALDFSS